MGYCGEIGSESKESKMVKLRPALDIQSSALHCIVAAGKINNQQLQSMQHTLLC